MEYDDNEYQRQQELVQMLFVALQKCDWIGAETIVVIKEYY